MANFSDYNWKESKTSSQKPSEQDLEKLIDKYSELNSDELCKEFLKMTLERKRQGELGDGELDAIKYTILPYLDKTQQQSLQSILEMIKNV